MMYQGVNVEGLEAYAEAVTAQASLMARVDPDEMLSASALRGLLIRATFSLYSTPSSK